MYPEICTSIMYQFLKSKSSKNRVKKILKEFIASRPMPQEMFKKVFKEKAIQYQTDTWTHTKLSENC